MIKILAFLLLTFTAYCESKPNVLLIAVDDLNSWIGCLDGHPDTKTPNIDRLAKSGMLFTNAHCQGTMCNPSRISIMWGKRPSSTGFYSNHYPVHKVSKFLKKNTSLVKYFQNNGYTTMTSGKVYHSSWIPQNEFDIVGPRPRQWQKGLDKAVNKKPKQYHATWDFGPQKYPEEKFIDYKVASWGVDQLAKSYEKPFFCALGFYRPHVPFFPPERVFNKFKNVKLPTVKENDWQDIPRAAKGITLNNKKIPTHEWMNQDGRWQKAVQSYLACVNWVDSQIGRVLDALEKSPNGKNTIVIFYSDHGYHLGEKQRWSKFSLWENTTRVPFIIKVPGSLKGKCSKAVELLSIFPTLIELCGLPSNNAAEGKSIAPLLKNPQADWPYAAISTLGQNNHAICDERWRYIRYADGSEELYDHKNDASEWHNLLYKEKHAKHFKTIKKLRNFLPKINRMQVTEVEK